MTTALPRPVVPTSQPTRNAHSQKSVKPTVSQAKESAQWDRCDKRPLIVALATVSTFAAVLVVMVIAGCCCIVRRRHSGEADLQKDNELTEELQFVKKPV